MEHTDFAKGTMWGIKPEAFDAIRRKYSEANLLISSEKFAEMQMDDQLYANHNGVAVISITGSISKRSSIFSFLFGGANVTDITHALYKALEDKEVDAILFDIDSPGGTVSGINELSQAIYEARAEKPIVAYSGGMMASAAYWLGSSADKVVVGKTADVGSIGVLMVHADLSENDKMNGIKVTYLTAGKYKALGNDAEPLSDLAKDVFTKELEYIYDIFTGDISRSRGVTAEEVHEKMADGRIFIGEQAVLVGLADYMGSIDDAYELALELVANKQSEGLPSGKGKAMLFQKEKVVLPSNVEELFAAYPVLAEEIRTQGAKSVDVEAHGKGMVSAEMTKVFELVSAEFGDEAGEKFKAVYESGITGAQLKAYKAVNPPPAPVQTEEDKKKAEMLAAIQAAGPANPGTGDGATGEHLTGVEKYRHEYQHSAELQTEFGTESSYVAFKTAEAAGKVKILRPKV